MGLPGRPGVVPHAVTNPAEPYNVNAVLPPEREGAAAEEVVAAVKKGGEPIARWPRYHS